MTGDLAFLVEARGAAAILYGLAVGALLYLLGLGRARGSTVGAIAVAATFLAGGWPAAHLIAMTLGMAGLVGRAVRPEREGRPGAVDVLALTGVFVACVWASALSPLDGHWLAAAVAGLAGAAGAWVARVWPTGDGAVRYRLPALTPRLEGSGIGANGLIAALIAAPVVTAASAALDLLGTGQAGPTAVGGVLGFALLGDGRGRLRATAAAVLSAATGAWLTAFLT